MTLNVNENSWAKAGGIVVIIATVIGLWAYLAGGIFLMAFDHKFEEATPLTLYQYWLHYRTDPQVEKWLYIASGISLALLLTPLLLFFGPGTKQSLFGDARFAKENEIKKAGLFGDKGIIIGKKGGRYLMFEGQQHAIISAPTRSGKGIGIVIPNLLNWPESVVVLDIKQENWDITSAYRAKFGQACYLFNPAAADYRTHRYNPLSYINEDPNFRIDDIQKIGNMLFPDHPGTDVIWTATPRSLFLGVCLLLLETPGKSVTLGQVLRETLADGDGSKYFTRIINERAASDKPLSGACVRGLNTYISISSENTRSGVIGGFRSRLELWMNPLVDAATSANDFDLRDVRKERMSIYLGVTPDNLDRMAPLLNLFFQQLIDLNTRELPNQNKAIKYTCMLLMDEFTAIGKIPILSKGISYIAGYWLRMMPIIQSPAQLVEVYGKDAAQTFQTNHALQIVYPPKASETQTAKDISEWLGYQTVKGISVSKSKSVFGKKTPSESQSDQRRALLLPQEITSLGKSRELVVMEDMPPILADKVVYFKDPVFVDRLKAVSQKLKTLGAKLPTKQQLDEAIEAGQLGAPVPEIDLETHNREVGEMPITVAVSQQEQTGTVERPVTPDDIPNLAKMTLANFAVDFSAVEKPVGDLDEVALIAYADSLSRQAGISVE
jgi:type IV secretion system protein VirD4